MTIPTSATAFDPSDATFRRDPYPYYHWLLRNDPVHRGPEGMWYVSRYADVRAVMSDQRLRRTEIGDFWAGLVGPGPLSEVLRQTIMFTDQPDHDRLRDVVGRAFSPPRLRALGNQVAARADRLISSVASTGSMDVINDLAFPLALGVLSDLLGLPAEDLRRVRSWSLGIGPTLDLAAAPDEIARGQQAMGELADYLNALLDERAGGQPGDEADLLTMMAAAEGERFSRTESISMAVTLIFAGHETVTNQIGNGVLALLRHPDQLDLLRRQPGLVPNAVEEILRYDSSVQSNSRLVGQPVEVAGTVLNPGDIVVALAGAANRDPAEFSDPDTFDVTREGVRPMSFGAGMRFCLGAVLARIELAAAFERLVRLDGMQLAVAEDDLRYQRSTMFRGVLALPVAFTPAAPPGRAPTAS